MSLDIFLTDLQLTLNPEFFDALPQRGARDAEQFGGMNLVVARFLEGFNDEFAFYGGNDFQFGIAARPLE